MSKIEIEIAANEDAQVILEEIALDVEAEALDVTLGVNKAGNVEASGTRDQVGTLCCHEMFRERFFGGRSVKEVKALIK
ncbi:MAG: hypothetical protein JWM57_529 [Phycisphaerales bacterium]|nr:hypothetical protein [Phycisphaerales bacterium]